MKRTAAILLALTLALVSVGAFADTLTIQPGTPINATLDIFQSVFGVIANAAGYTFTWEEAPVSGEGYGLRGLSCVQRGDERRQGG